MAGGPDQPGPDDVRFDDVPDPDLESLSRAMAGQQGDPMLDYPGAFVSVRRMRPAEWNQPSLPFSYCFDHWQQLRDYGTASRQSFPLEAAALWVVHVVGAYEGGNGAAGAGSDDGDPCPQDADHDPDGEGWRAGITVWPPSPWVPTEEETSFVFVEVARDLSAAMGGLPVNETISHVAAHEVGHQFGLADADRHPEDHLMDAWDLAQGRSAWRWLETDIQQIRETVTP